MSTEDTYVDPSLGIYTLDNLEGLQSGTIEHNNSHDLGDMKLILNHLILL
jgi:hypothetical protein